MTNPKPITLHEIQEETKKRVSVIEQELLDGFELLAHQPKSVTIFGSARITNGPYYDSAKKLAHDLVREGYSIVTGGGPGIMEGANRGAFEGHGRSIGLNIELPHEQSTNGFTTHHMHFYYFFTRKVMLAFSAEAYVFFPGGFGTLDEFFEILTLVQNGKIEPVPIILFGSEYWNPLNEFIEKTILQNFKAIVPEDTKLYTITDDPSLVIETIKKVPIRNGIRLHFKNTSQVDEQTKTN